jgi:DNA-directed RNA polymerase specialized sigma24 family protein
MTEAAPSERAPFDALFARLGRDEPAQLAYERLRQRLIQFFRLHVPPEAEELADLALDRLARRLYEGTEVDHPQRYALGVARMILLEARTRLARQRLAEQDPTWSEVPDVEDALQQEAAVAALGECLEQLGDRARALILSYYGADGAQRIRSRQRLASELGSSLNALRNRALRLRETLERCVRERLKTVDQFT